VERIEQQPVVDTPRTERRGSILASWLSSTDHKIIGHLYLITSFFFFLCAGVMALLMRIQLLGPDRHFVSDRQYNELFTMHGILMLLLFATPLFIGFANEMMPLQIGAPDVAFPRLNILSYYFFAFGGLILLASFLSPGGAASFGWYAYAPLNSAIYSPEIGADMFIMGLVLSGLGTILSGVNFVTTIFCMRAPGMTMFRMPIFTWNALLTSILVLMAFPVLATIAIAGLSMTVWAHHMFTTGAVLLPFFSFMTFLIAVPTGVKFFNWVGTMWRGQLTFEPPMLFTVGFMITFLFGGITGIILASPPLDFAVSDT
jgi:cytochrome c oxidase subunit I